MDFDLTNIEQITKEWLTEVLRSNGYLIKEFVTNLCKTEKQPTRKSTHTKLEVKYSKSNISDLDPDLDWKNEVEFYKTLKSITYENYLLTCYKASYSLDSKCAYLLLEDLSELYFQTVYPLPPEIGDCKSAINCLAKHHSE
jgi:hypothetical protein